MACASLTDVIIPDGVKTIGKSAFEGCVSLLNVALPNSLEKIGEDAFYGCDKLINVAIPDGTKLTESNCWLENPSLLKIAEQQNIFNPTSDRDELEQVSRSAELQLLRRYIRENCFDEEIACDRLQFLWTAYCLHHNLATNAPSYNSDLLELWGILLEKSEGDMCGWGEYVDFSEYMSKYL